MTENKTSFKIGRLAAETEISAALIRAWEKRYALWKPERSPGGQRLYGREDRLLIGHLANATRDGLRIGELAALGRKELLQQMESADKASPEQGGTHQHHAVRLDSYIRPLVSAAESLDLKKLQHGFKRALLELTSDQVVYGVIIPTMEEVGQSYLAGRISVAGEHLISSMGEHFLRNCMDQARQTLSEQELPSVLCSCFPGEDHRLGLLAVSYGLTREGCNVVYLGAALPVEGLEMAIIQLEPASIWLSVTSSQLFERYRDEYSALVRRHHLQFVFGGQGLPSDDPLQDEINCHFWKDASLTPSTLQSFICRPHQ